MKYTITEYNRKKWLWLILPVVWLAILLFLYQTKQMVLVPGKVPLHYLWATLIPFTIFFILYASVPSFKWLVHNIDIRFLTFFQCFRVADFIIIGLALFDLLPLTHFGIPHAMIDPPFAILSLIFGMKALNNPSFNYTKTFLIFQALGIILVLMLFFLGTLTSGYFPSFWEGPPTTRILFETPLMLIPDYVAQIAMIFNMMAIIQILNKRKNDKNNQV